MTLWRFTIEVDIPEDTRPTQVLGAMADAALRRHCYVAEEAGMERIDPPLKLVSQGGTDGE